MVRGLELKSEYPKEKKHNRGLSFLPFQLYCKPGNVFEKLWFTEIPVVTSHIGFRRGEARGRGFELKSVYLKERTILQKLDVPIYQRLVLVLLVSVIPFEGDVVSVELMDSRIRRLLSQQFRSLL